MKALLRDLRLRERRDMLKDILENAMPTTAAGRRHRLRHRHRRMREGRLMQETYANKIYSRHRGKADLSAIQMTTAAGICAVLDLLAGRQLPGKGLVRQEDIPLEDFLANRFGRVYATETGPGQRIAGAGR